MRKASLGEAQLRGLAVRTVMIKAVRPAEVRSGGSVGKEEEPRELRPLNFRAWKETEEEEASEIGGQPEQ